jgi:diguanylate cyclase
VSARDLLSRDFADLLKNQLLAYGVPAHSICLEITESALMEDANLAKKTLAQLHDVGVNLSIDNYGTGYASLSYLKNFPADEIKIDREFVKNMATSRTAAAIVRSTIELAHELGLVVVAEGVEEQTDLELLAARDCDMVQGYFISRLLPVDNFVRWWNQSAWGQQAAAERIPDLRAA